MLNVTLLGSDNALSNGVLKVLSPCPARLVTVAVNVGGCVGVAANQRWRFRRVWELRTMVRVSDEINSKLPGSTSTADTRSLPLSANFTSGIEFPRYTAVMG